MQRDLEGKVRKNPGSRLFAPLADVYRKNGKLAEAVALLERGLVRHPNYGSARVLLARCHEDLGEWDRAREAWLRVLEGDPGSLVAFRGLGEIAVWTGDGAEAARWFRRYLEEFPGDERVCARLAEVEAGLAEVETGLAEEAAPEGTDPADATGCGAEDRAGDEAAPDSRIDAPEDAPGEGEPQPVDTTEPDTVAEEDVVAEGEDVPAGGAVIGTVASGDSAHGAEEAAAPGHAGSAPEETDLARTGSDSLETMTLAEIYAQQGFYERAVEIYRRIERQGPANGRIRDRIRFLEARLSAPRPEGGGRSAEAGEVPDGLSTGRAAADGNDTEALDGPISINEAGSSELEAIPGVGPVIARKIVVERERNGPFSDGRDMRRVPSLGRRLIERIEPYLTFDEILRGGDVADGGALAAAAAGCSPAEEEGAEAAESTATATAGEEGEDAEFEEFKRWLKNLRK